MICLFEMQKQGQQKLAGDWQLIYFRKGYAMQLCCLPAMAELAKAHTYSAILA